MAHTISDIICKINKYCDVYNVLFVHVSYYNISNTLFTEIVKPKNAKMAQQYAEANTYLAPQYYRHNLHF